MREAVLEEAYLYQQKIDRATYELQRDLLRETVALATIELQDATLDEIDVEGVLRFAEHFLAHSTRTQGIAGATTAAQLGRGAMAPARSSVMRTLV